MKVIKIKSAKIYSIDSANQIVDALDINNNFKVQIKEQTKKEIESGQSQKDGSYISEEQKQDIIDKIYISKVENKDLSQQEQDKIHKSVEQGVNEQVMQVNKKIQKINEKISKTTMQFMLQAFTLVYKKFIILIFLSIFVVILFPNFKR